MENDSQTKTRIEITQDKLVDILLHAATREDLATLAADTKAGFAMLATSTKADFAKVDTKFDKLEAKLDKLDAKIEAVATENRAATSELSKKIDKLIYLVLATLIIPTALHFLIK